MVNVLEIIVSVVFKIRACKNGHLFRVIVVKLMMTQTAKIPCISEQMPLFSKQLTFEFSICIVQS